MPFITQLQHDLLIDAKQNNTYANHICDTSCALGKTKQFKVKGTKLSLDLKCTQSGGMWSGSHCFILVK